MKLDVPLFPSEVAEITAVPSSSAVTTTASAVLEGDRLATFRLLDVQVTLGLSKVLPETLVTLAVKRIVSPSWRLTVAGLTVTEATDSMVGPVASLGVSLQLSKPKNRIAGSGTPVEGFNKLIVIGFDPEFTVTFSIRGIRG